VAHLLPLAAHALGVAAVCAFTLHVGAVLVELRPLPGFDDDHDHTDASPATTTRPLQAANPQLASPVDQ
jgi:hypothetical protein